MIPAEYTQLLDTLATRFTKHPARHEGLDWGDVLARIDAAPQALASVREMEHTGGEPDVVAIDRTTGRVTFVDCAPESPAGRRSLCYDRRALDGRKENKPRSSALEMADSMGIEVLTEEEYRALQRLGEFDLKTSSWILTPTSVRDLGGALFCDRRFGQVFVYHNGAESYYAARGFRGKVEV